MNQYHMKNDSTTTDYSTNTHLFE